MCDIPVYSQIDLNTLLALACDARGVSVKDAKSKKRNREFTEARFAYFILAKQLTNHFLKDIGEKVNRGHCDVLHGINILEKKEIPIIKTIVNDVKKLTILWHEGAN